MDGNSRILKIKTMKLQSMTDFVILKWSIDIPIEIRKQIKNYADFLKQPLEMSMFVPTDDEGRVLEPDAILHGGPEGWKDYYKKAKEKVLFEGFEVTESVYDNTGQSLFVGWEPYNAAIFIKLKGEDWKLDDYKTIEDLLLSGYEIELTESALKQIGIDE